MFTEALIILINKNHLALGIFMVNFFLLLKIQKSCMTTEKVNKRIVSKE